MSRMRPPLTTSMTSPVTVSPALNFSSTLIQARSYSARFLGEDQATVLVVLLENESLDLVAKADNL